MFTVLHNVSWRIPCSCMKQIIRKQIMVLISHIVVGTLGYVMSELEDGKPLSQVVKAAKSLGFTEPGSSHSWPMNFMAYLEFAIYE